MPPPMSVAENEQRQRDYLLLAMAAQAPKPDLRHWQAADHGWRS